MISPQPTNGPSALTGPATKPSLTRRLQRVRAFLAHDLWAIDLTNAGFWRRWRVRQLRTLVLAYEGLNRDRLPLRAGALTYQTVFAIVPMVAVIFSIFRAFGGLQAVSGPIQDWLLKNLATGSGEAVVGHMQDFVTKVDAGAIGSVGLLALIVTVVALFSTFEKSLNDIWGVRRGRPLLRRFTLLWSIITIGPIVLGASISMTAAVQNEEFVRRHLREAWIGDVAAAMVPFFFAWCLFAFLYAVGPNTKVSFRAALTGGVIAGTVWEITKTGYVLYNAKVVTVSRIYGSLGAIPVLLLWLYISWLIVLFGAEIACAAERVRTHQRDFGGRALSPAGRERLALRIVQVVCRQFVQGLPALTPETIGQRLALSGTLVTDVAQPLIQKGVLSGAADGVLLPAVAPERITVAGVLGAVREHGLSPTLPAGEGHLGPVETVLDRAVGAAAVIAENADFRSLAMAGEVGPSPLQEPGAPESRSGAAPPASRIGADEGA